MEQPQRAFTPHNAPIKDAKLLPVQAPAQIFGRNRELGAGHAALKAGTAILLHGPSGIGKTAVAAVLAAAYTAQNSGGVLWFTMTEDDADLLMARVGRAYGVNALTTSEDANERQGMARALLERNRPLIVLDGLTDIDAVRDFMRGTAAGIPLIVTNESQAAGPWTPMAIKLLSIADSTALLRALSGLQDTSYNEDLEGVARVLSGDPLALELAGRHIATDDVTPAELLTALLGAVPPGVSTPDPQQTILSVVYKRLPPAVQGIFLILGVTFAGGASAELISDLSNVPAAQVVPMMRQLVGRGLVHEAISYNQFRYTFHESIQTYARRWLESTGRLQVIENRVMQAVVAYTLRHARSDVQNQDRLAAELDNILGAAAFATATHQEQPVRQLAQALGQQAGDFVTLRGFQTELAQLRKLLFLLGKGEVAESQPTAYQASIALPRATQSIAIAPTVPTEVPEPAQAAPPQPDRPDPADLFETHDALLALDQVLEPEPPPVAAEPAAAPETIPDAEPAPALEPLLDLETTQPHQSTQPLATISTPEPPEEPVIPDDTAKDSVKDSVVEVPPTPLGLFTRQSPTVSAAANELVDEPTAPAPLFTREEPPILNPEPALLPVSAPIPTAPMEEPTVLSISTLQGKIAEARADGDLKAQARYLQRLGDAYASDGDSTRAVNAYQQAVEVSRGSEDWLAIGLLMGKLGNAYLDAGQPKEAALMLEQALTIFRRERRSDYEMRILGTLGSAYGELRNWPKAQDYHEQALFLAREQQDQLEEGTQLGNIAYVRELSGEREGAIAYYRQGLHLAYLLNDSTMQGDYAYQLGRLLLDDSRTLNQSAQLLSDADALIPHSADIERLLKRARKRLEHLLAGGVDIPAALDNQQYASEAYPTPVS